MPTTNPQNRLSIVQASNGRGKEIGTNDFFPTEDIRLSPEVRIVKFDNSLCLDSLLIITSKRHIQIEGIAKDFLLYLSRQSGPVGVRELLKAFIEENKDKSISEEYVRRIVDKLLDLDVLERTLPFSGTRRSNKRRKSSYFLLRIPIVPAGVVAAISRILLPIVSEKLILGLTPVLILLQTILWYSIVRYSTTTVHSLPSHDLLILLAGNYFGLLLHEFGHAASCLKGGETPGPIGFGIYLIFPVFYTDVSSAWVLPKKERLCVDIAGIYITLILSITASGLFLITQHAVWALMATVYCITVAACLNPFIKMDGYWFLSDLLGLPNLMNLNKSMSKWMLNRIIGREAALPKVFSLPKSRRWIYLVYYVLFAFFLSFMTIRFYLWYVPHLVQIVPSLISKIINNIETAGMSVKLFKPCLQLALRTIPVIAPLLYAGRVIRQCRSLVGRNEAII